jgi:hypothetical protein
MNCLFTEVLDGRNAHLTDGVQRALGARRGTLPITHGRRRPLGYGACLNVRRTLDPTLMAAGLLTLAYG